MKILFVLTSHSELGDTDKKTGFWIEEFAAPYYVLTDAGAEVTIASPAGGQPPVDPSSEAPDAQTIDTIRFNADVKLKSKMASTVKLDDIDAEDFDAVFYPGGHGPMWDLANNTTSIALIEKFYNSEKPIAFVCHAPAALLHTKDNEGVPIVKGKNVTGFSNTEEAAVKLTDVVPFLLEDELIKLGANYSKANDWAPFIKKDGLLITGQNPASSKPVANLLLEILTEKITVNS